MKRRAAEDVSEDVGESAGESVDSSFASPRILVVDAESDSSFAQAPGLTHDDKLERMRATLVCALELHAGNETTHHFWCDDAQGFKPLLALMDEVDVIVTYNGATFDMPLLRKHYTSSARYYAHRFKHLDLFARLRDATGIWISLTNLATSNGLQPKTGNGLQAIDWWHAGNRDDLLAYCHSDVRILATLACKQTLVIPNVGEIPRKVWKWSVEN